MRVIGIAATHSKEALLESGAERVVERLVDLNIRAIDSQRLEIQIW